MRILLAEDDTVVAYSIQAFLGSQGHKVDWVDNGVKARSALQAFRFDIILLDLGLPEVTGLQLLRELPQLGIETPVLIITGQGALQDRVQGLDLGADDYLVKPFAPEELAARIRALSRRSPQKTDRIRLGYLTLDTQSREAFLNDRPVELTTKEYNVLLQLARNLGRVITREQIEENLYGWNDNVGSNAVEVHIHHLRKKLGKELIHTVRGVGYLIKREASAVSAANDC